jgi:hypothetical protein
MRDKFKQICYSLFGAKVLDIIGGGAGKNFYE